MGLTLVTPSSSACRNRPSLTMAVSAIRYLLGDELLIFAVVFSDDRHRAHPFDFRQSACSLHWRAHGQSHPWSNAAKATAGPQLACVDAYEEHMVSFSRTTHSRSPSAAAVPPKNFRLCPYCLSSYTNLSKSRPRREKRNLYGRIASETQPLSTYRSRTELEPPKSLGRLRPGSPRHGILSLENPQREAEAARSKKRPWSGI